MSYINQYIPGEWAVICDVCGFKKKASQLRKRWDGLMVCEEDWEQRHPQDLIKSVPEDTAVPYTRPEATDTFIGPTYIATSLGVQETTIPSGNFTTNNETL